MNRNARKTIAPIETARKIGRPPCAMPKTAPWFSVYVR
jgi:hypothetical protein